MTAYMDLNGIPLSRLDGETQAVEDSALAVPLRDVTEGQL
jgi:hypothetical protein